MSGRPAGSPSEVVIFPPREQIYLSDTVLAAGGLVCLAFGLPSGQPQGVMLAIFGGLVLVGAVVSAAYVASGRHGLMLRPEGLVVRKAGREHLLPAEEIRAIGVARTGRFARLAVWYDPEASLDVAFRRYAGPGSSPGLLRLIPVGGKAFPRAKLTAIQAVVESSGMAQWRASNDEPARSAGRPRRTVHWVQVAAIVSSGVAGAVVVTVVLARALIPKPDIGGCHPTDTGTRVPQSAPPQVNWSLYKTVALPASRAAGPLINEGDVARCYAHTPTGALIAATQISLRVSAADDYVRVITTQVAPGPGRDKMLGLRDQAPTLRVTPGEAAQIAGFRFIAFTPQTAVVQLANRGPSGGMGVFTITVVWDGDWKLLAQPDGQAGPPPARISSLHGYVPWGGV